MPASHEQDTACREANEKAARVELAAFYRLVEHLGWGEGIYNHIAMRVPDEPDQMLIKPHAMTYEEVTASSLVKVDIHEDIDEASGVNKIGFTTHAPIMRARRDVNCSIHLHTTPIMAIAAHPRGLRMVHQASIFFYDDIAYQDFEGLAEGVGDQDRISDDLGTKSVLIMRNHGAVLTGVAAEHVFAATIRLMHACEIQLAVEAAGQGVVEVAPDICQASIEQLRRHDAGRGSADWPAWLRRLDRIDPSYKT